MHAVPVLCLTHDAALWQHWRTIGDSWLPARGQTLADLERWREQGRSLVLLDADLPGLPDWSEPYWETGLSELKVIVGTMRPNDEQGKRVLASGAVGYMHALSPAEVLSTALKSVSSGNVWIGSTLLARLLRQIDRAVPQQADWHEGLTTREKEIAERAAIGHSNQAIADAFGISERTVRAHLSAVFEKLNVSDRLLLALKVHGIK